MMKTSSMKRISKVRTTLKGSLLTCFESDYFVIMWGGGGGGMFPKKDYVIYLQPIQIDEYSHRKNQAIISSPDV